jgi:hypothetical protein
MLQTIIYLYKQFLEFYAFAKNRVLQVAAANNWLSSDIPASLFNLSSTFVI